ncbi:MAG: Dolichyl-phosphate-mannose-protein mannosyltransferase family protein [Parcubacteria group bacterium GW2011_GWA1_40_21]|nr:MAG: Dolichyl-phosphate-mannose-protein mannosyltransferase family protein [Parcubacteria group bacterium GW2011_GWA1_40_21]
MKNIKYKKITYILGVLLGLLILYLWFGGIFYGDIYSDNALNSFRALGWFDRLLGGQSTPIDWFGRVPGWAILSFHDAPPLVFFIQHIFFFFLGPSLLAARLPFIFAGLSSAFLIFYFIKKIFNLRIAILAALAFLANSYAVWAALAGYLEGIQQVFIVLAFFFLFLFLQNDYKTKYLYLWSGFLALSLISKYTSLFLLIPPFIFAVLEYKKIFRKIGCKKIIAAVIIFFAIAAPVIIYNLNVYKTRGHFDAALSSIVGMHPDDFITISGRKADFNLWGNFRSTISTIFANNSYPFALAVLFSFAWLAAKIARRKNTKFDLYLAVNVASLFVMFSFFGAGVRFVSIITPIASIALGLAFYDWYKLAEGNRLKKILVPAYISLIAAMLIFEMFYAFNTNVFRKPIGAENKMFSSYRIKNYGFNQLEDYIRKNLITDLPRKQSPRSLADLSFSNEDFTGRNVIIFDDRINWFAQYWYFQKYLNYYRLPVISTSYLSQSGPALKIKDLQEISERDVHYIYPLKENILDTTRKANSEISSIGINLAEKLDGLKVPYDIIKNLAGEDAFKIYKISPEYSPLGN